MTTTATTSSSSTSQTASTSTLACVQKLLFDEASFLHDLVHLKDSQEHIQSLSAWCLGHSSPSKSSSMSSSKLVNTRSASDVFKIARCWSKVVCKARRAEQKLVLFYLANDLLQHASHAILAETSNSKKRTRNMLVIDKWKPVLIEVVDIVSKQLINEQKIREKIERVLDIWKDRNVFIEDKEFVTQLKHKLISSNEDEDEDNDDDNNNNDDQGGGDAGGAGSTRGTKNDEVSFQPSLLGTQLKILKALEDDCEYKLKLVNGNELSDLDAESVEKWRFTLKDRQHGADFLTDFEDGHTKLEAYLKALEKELNKRRQVLEMLNQGSKYYANLVDEANIVADAYCNFGKRVNLTRDKLEERLPQLQSNEFSPMPSPDYDAPSPKDTDNMDLELPDEPMPSKNIEMIDLVEGDGNGTNDDNNGDLTSRLDSMRGVMNAGNVSQSLSKDDRRPRSGVHEVGHGSDHANSSLSFERSARRDSRREPFNDYQENNFDRRRHRSPSSDHYKKPDQSSRAKRIDYRHAASSSSRRPDEHDIFSATERGHRGSRPMQHW